MRRTRVGIDRIATQELRAQVGGCKMNMDLHVAHCYQCKHAGSDVYGHCREWWRLAVALHRLRKRLRRAELPDEPQQDTLPGMEIP